MKQMMKAEKSKKHGARSSCNKKPKKGVEDDAEDTLESTLKLSGPTESSSQPSKAFFPSSSFF